MRQRGDWSLHLRTVIHLVSVQHQSSTHIKLQRSGDETCLYGETGGPNRIENQKMEHLTVLPEGPLAGQYRIAQACSYASAKLQGML